MNTENVSNFQFRKHSIVSASRGNIRGMHIAGNRKDVLNIIFNYPASSVSRIAREMRLTPNTIKWHLSALLRMEYICEERVDNRAIYYPVNFIGKQEAQMLAVLNDEEAGAVFSHVFRNPGKSQKEIREALSMTQNTAGYFLRKLTHVEILTETQNGKFKYYSPSPLFMSVYMERGRKNSDILAHLVSKLRASGYFVEMYAEDGICTVAYTYKRETERMHIRLNPFDSIIQRS